MSSLRRRPLIVAGIGAVVTAGAGGTATQIGPWYRSLEKSSLNPPDVVFPIAWTIIFALIAVSAAVAWSSATDLRRRVWILSLFVINAILNVTWSLMFFALQRPDISLGEVFVLWLSVASLVVVSWPVSRLAAILLLPYLFWVGFAAYLNYRIVVLNPELMG